ncbi:MAG: formate dehydrogenase family accessory protein FdhD [Acidobacteria bacterium RIFCSPLOWO2_02_FULL_64_15]|nr:MAG: formate dehydrogenase family accessory protein FdhD [Acidobacteria bacterium RIFCSPLOWO2_02_FULL_64_15]
MSGLGGTATRASTLVRVDATTRQVPVRRSRDGTDTIAVDEVAEEAPIAFTYHNIPHVVMLATPADLEDLAVGFTVSEALVANASEISSVDVIRSADAIEVRVGVASERVSQIVKRQRNLTGRTGCGLCGVETVEEAIRRPPAVGAGVRVTSAELHAALAELETRQRLNARTGSVHAAAWVRPGRGVEIVREDVGRHNALDKVIGALLRSSTDPAAGFAIVTSRASYEMVQKTATAGIAFLVAVSAPTGLAIRLAQACGLTLVGFARAHQHVVYAGAERLDP